MKQKYYQLIAVTLCLIFFIQSSKEIYSQETLSANTPFIQVNGKTIKFGSAIIAFSKIRQSNAKIDEKTIFSQIVQQLINEELLGGLIIQVGSNLIDTSIRTKLNKIKNAMKGAN